MEYIKIEDGVYEVKGESEVIKLQDLEDELSRIKQTNTVIKEQMEWRNSLPLDKQHLVEFHPLQDEMELGQLINSLRKL